MKPADLCSEDVKNLLDSLLGSLASKYFDAADQKNVPITRFNPLKHHSCFQEDLLTKEGFQFDALRGIPGYKVLHQPVPIGKSLSHFLGHIYIQDASSMLPALILDPKPGERILDLCAAPGSKTTQIAAMMQNRGVLIATDLSSKRIRSLVFNLRRMGAINTAVLKAFGEQAGNRYFEYFDRVLLDPPCSALGTIHKSPEVLSWWSFERTRRLCTVQKKLLESALKSLRPGGVLVYSTCTITPQENEEVIEEAINRFPVELESIEWPGYRLQPGLVRYGSRRYSPSLSKAVRIYPFENDGEGFFVARIRKTGSFGQQRFRKPQAPINYLRPAQTDPDSQKILQFISENFAIPSSYFSDLLFHAGSDLWAAGNDLEGTPFYDQPITFGLPIAHIRGFTPKITTEGCHLFGHLAGRNVLMLDRPDQLERFVNREPIETDLADRHQVLVGQDNWIIGHGLVDRGILHSRFPRSGWKFSLTGDKN